VFAAVILYQKAGDLCSAVWRLVLRTTSYGYQGDTATYKQMNCITVCLLSILIKSLKKG
jgi:hypothetical protein